ncbi:MAG TPA: hypothetical protein VK438_12785 [Xanthobacteraceae bacterium]|nr:hypothetical protein [Xanthobacteraceae bacterium]
MSLQNRVTPFGELIATPARGTMFGIRGGRFHRDDRTLGQRRWASRRWICCLLSFKGRRHHVWGPRGYTDLFFLDEVTALAAGHRPCFECRRAAATAFAQRWAQTKGTALPYVDDMDRVLQAERLDGRAKRLHRMPAADLPEGAMIAHDGAAFALQGTHLLRWSESGYAEKLARPRGTVDVLTPPSTVAILRAGYQPQWHPSAA